MIIGLTHLIQFATSKYGIMILAAFLAVQGYLLIRPLQKPLDPARAQAADRVCERIVKALSDEAQDTWSAKYVKVARLAGDHGDHIRSRIEAALPARTNCRLVTDSVLAEMRDTIMAKAARLGIVKTATADRWKIRPVTGLNDALALSKSAGVEYVVYGAVEDFRALGEQTYARVSVALADAASGETVFQQSFEDGNGDVFAAIDPDLMAGEAKRAGWRFVGWVLFVLLLPVCTGSFWVGLLERESNVTNALCLLFLTLLSTLLAWALMGFWMGTVWNWLTLALAFTAAVTWNLFVLSLLERNRVERALQ